MNTNESDINDHQKNDSIGESDFDTDEEDDIAQLNGLKIGNAIESEEISQTESGKQQSKEIKLNDNDDSDSDQSDGKENESIGESDFDTDEENDTEQTNE